MSPYHKHYVEAVREALYQSGNDPRDAEYIITSLCSAEDDHIAVFRSGDYTPQHPIRERLTKSIFDCPVNSYLSSLSQSPVSPGTYIVQELEHGGWLFTPEEVKNDSE
jgi:hypothetical protein